MPHYSAPAEAAHAAAQAAVDAVNRLPALLRQSLADHQWSLLALTVNESSYAPAQPANTPLYVNPQSSNPALIRAVVASLPSGATGLVTLGGITIPVGGGLSVIPYVELQLQTSDTRSVVSDTVGPLSLWLTGQQLAPFGML